MKRKQVIIDRIEDMDNHLVSLHRALQMPGITFEKAEQYLILVREKLKEVENMVKLED